MVRPTWPPCILLGELLHLQLWLCFQKVSHRLVPEPPTTLFKRLWLLGVKVRHSRQDTSRISMNSMNPSVKSTKCYNPRWQGHSPFFISAAIFGYLASYSWTWNEHHGQHAPKRHSSAALSAVSSVFQVNRCTPKDLMSVLDGAHSG